MSYDQDVVNVEYEPAASPPKSGKSHSCETSSLHYEVFHSYLDQRDFSEESFFDAIRLLRTPQSARANGREVSGTVTIDHA